MNLIRFGRSAAPILLLLLAAGASRAAAPRTIPLQGTITTPAGVPLNGTYTFTFTLYNAANLSVWSETQSLSVQNGRFVSQLGAATAFPDDLGFDALYTVGVRVGTDPEMTPRLPLGSVPSALNLALPAASETASASTALSIRNSGLGSVLNAEITSTANSERAMHILHRGTGPGLTLWMTNAANSSRALDINHAGNGTGVRSFSVGGIALWGITQSTFSPAVIGDNAVGEAVIGRSSANGVGAVVGRNDGTGYGVRGFSAGSGIGILGQAGIFGGTGQAGGFVNTNAASTTDVVHITGNGHGNSLVVNQTHATNSSATARNIAVFQSQSARVARINKEGRGYFNGGTQASGADVAEAFAVVGDRNAYEPGDVLAIATDHQRTVTKTAEPYSTLVSGVVATKPGLTLTERHIDEDLSDLVLMGVLGVVPTKVSTENGAIRAGDLLVSSSAPGHAMKGTDRARMIGAILGKALEPFDGAETGVIQVLVSLK